MDKVLLQLETVLTAEIAAHERLLKLLHQKLSALRRADHEKVADCCQQENQQIQTIGELEKERLTQVAALTQIVAPQAPQPLRMSQLAEHLPEPARGRLLVLRQQLRGQIEQVRQESAIARRAAESLLAHMQGLVRTIGSVMNGGATYGRTGAPPRSVSAISTFQATA
jgi:hypothetical protein